jgi:hypothetical protein
VHKPGTLDVSAAEAGLLDLLHAQLAGGTTMTPGSAASRLLAPIQPTFRLGLAIAACAFWRASSARAGAERARGPTTPTRRA